MRLAQGLASAGLLPVCTLTPGVVALSLNTSKPERVADNVALVNDLVPGSFWEALKANKLLSASYKFHKNMTIDSHHHF